MENIIDELLKKSSILDISARITHFMVHTENQVDLWLVSHNFIKDDTYNEMCRDAGCMMYTITQDLILHYDTISDRMHTGVLAMSEEDVLSKLLDCCRKFMITIFGDRLGSENCARYDIDFEVSDDESAMKIYIPKYFVFSLRDKIFNILNDDSLYGNYDGIIAVTKMELVQHKILSEAIKSYNGGM